MHAESAQLVKCLVENPQDQSSLRLIERHNYDLWHYLVSTKHNLKVLECTLCMWVNAEEYMGKESIYKRAGQVEDADRLTLMVFDDTGHFANTTRYSLAEDSEQLEAILISHVPVSVRQERQYSLHKDKGFLVVTGPLKQLKLLETGTNV